MGQLLLLHQQLGVQFIFFLIEWLRVVVGRFGLIDFHVSIILVGRMKRLQHIQLVELGIFAKTANSKQKRLLAFCFNRKVKVECALSCTHLAPDLSKLREVFKMPLHGNCGLGLFCILARSVNLSDLTISYVSWNNRHTHTHIYETFNLNFVHITSMHAGQV